MLFRFQVPTPIFESGFWIPVVSSISDSKAQDSGFQKQNFPRFRILQPKIYRISHSKRNFVSPNCHVMFYLLYKHQWNTKPFHFNGFLVRGAIYSVAIAMVIFSRVKIMLFSHVKISSFRAKSHLLFHWCLYNKVIYSLGFFAGWFRRWKIGVSL